MLATGQRHLQRSANPFQISKLGAILGLDLHSYPRAARRNDNGRLDTVPIALVILIVLTCEGGLNANGAGRASDTEVLTIYRRLNAGLVPQGRVAVIGASPAHKDRERCRPLAVDRAELE